MRVFLKFKLPIIHIWYCVVCYNCAARNFHTKVNLLNRLLSL